MTVELHSTLDATMLADWALETMEARLRADNVSQVTRDDDRVSFGAIDDFPPGVNLQLRGIARGTVHRDTLQSGHVYAVTAEVEVTRGKFLWAVALPRVIVGLSLANSFGLRIDDFPGQPPRDIGTH